MVDVEEVKVYSCPMCDREYNNYSKAEGCCPSEPEQLIKFQCGQCEEVHKDKWDAKECCKKQTNPEELNDGNNRLLAEFDNEQLQTM